MNVRRGAHKRDQLVGIHRHVAGVLAAEGGFGGAVLQEVAGHPVVFAGAGQVLHGFAEIAAVQFGAAFAGGADEHDGEARVEGHGHQRGLAVARNALDADLLGVHGFVGFQIIQAARRAPGPGAQRAPVVRLARLAFVDQADDALGQARAVVGLDAAGIDGGVAPAGGDQLFGRRADRGRVRPPAAACRSPASRPRAEGVRGRRTSSSRAPDPSRRPA